MKDIQIPDTLPTDERLYAMSLVAKMKDAADRVGAGFIGGFIAPDGTKDQAPVNEMQLNDPQVHGT